MSNNNFPDDNYRPTTFDERSQYRFEDYQNESYQQNSSPYPPHPTQPENFQPQFAHAKDEQHLSQLSLGFKIYAGINAFFSCIPFIHLFIGIMMVTGRLDDGKTPPPAAFGWFFIVFASVFIIGGWALSICSFYAGRFLKEHRNYTFCFVMSCINCVMMPFGTVLGVFSILILTRDSVKNIFDNPSPNIYR
jgi:hypothetical protein